jgi:hypothetical protein
VFKVDPVDQAIHHIVKGKSFTVITYTCIVNVGHLFFLNIKHKCKYIVFIIKLVYFNVSYRLRQQEKSM